MDSIYNREYNQEELRADLFDGGFGSVFIAVSTKCVTTVIAS